MHDDDIYLERLEFLISHGADVTALAGAGRTPLMHFALWGADYWCTFMERLLEEPAVLATIDTQTTEEIEIDQDDPVAPICPGGMTALHWICRATNGQKGERTRIVELLLAAKADPTIEDDEGDTPLMALRKSVNLGNHAIASLLEDALADAERAFLLLKARYITEALHLFKKTAAAAKGKANDEDNKRAACLAKAPSYLAARVAADQAVPVVCFPKPKKELRPWKATPETKVVPDETQKVQTAVLQYVLRPLELGEEKGMPLEVFVDWMDMIAPRWWFDEEGRRRGGGVRGEEEEAVGEMGEGKQE